MPDTASTHHHIYKALRIAGISVATMLGILLLLTLLLYLPPVQNWAVRQVATYASEQTGMNISVGHVQLAFPLDLEVEDILATQPCDTLPQGRDTIAQVHSVVAHVQMLPLIHGIVNIDRLALMGVKLNTADIVHEARVRGTIGRLAVQAHGIDLGHSDMHIDDAQLAQAQLNIELSDTVPPDTTKTPNYWKISVSRLAITKSAVTVHTPGDTLAIGTQIGSLQAIDSYFDLYRQLYRISHLEMEGSQITYDNHLAESSSGIDYNHLAFSKISMGIDSIYCCMPRIEAQISHCTMAEKSGLQLTHLKTQVAIDSLALHIPMLSASTPHSSIKAQAQIDLSVLDSITPGRLTANLRASIGKQDLVLIATDMIPQKIARQLPNQPLIVTADINGNLRKAHLTHVQIAMPTAFDIQARGQMAHLDTPAQMTADIALQAHTYHMGFVTAALPSAVARQIRIPYGISLKSHLTAQGSRYAATLTLKEGHGTLSGRATIDTRRMAYSAQLQAQRLQIRHFLPHGGVGTLTASLQAHGVGTDPLSPATQAHAQIHLGQIDIAQRQIGSTQASISMAGGRIHLNASGHNSLLDGLIDFAGIANGKRISGTLTCNLSHADLARMGITDKPIGIGVCSHIDIDTNLKDRHRIIGSIGDISIQTAQQTYRPEDIDIDVLATRDTTHAAISSGDFSLRADAHGSYQRLMRHATLISNEIRHQTKGHYIDQIRLRQRLPQACIRLYSGRRNAFARFMKWSGYEVGLIDIDMDCSPQTGVNGYISADSLVAASILLDTVRIKVMSDSVRTTFQAQIHNNRQNPDYTFKALLRGGVYEHGAYATTQVYDADDKLGLRLGLAAAMQTEGIKLHLYGDPPILGYKQFTANKDNYILLGDNQRVSANLKLATADGMGIQLYSDDDNTDAQQDITLSLAKFDLHKVLSVIPYTPNIEGIMDGDFHIVKTLKELSVSSSVSINNMKYEQCAMGDIGSDFVYMPKDDGTHSVDGILMHNGNEVGTIQGTYKSEDGGWLDAALGLQRMPMELANGFVPDRIIGLRGYGEGTLSVRGSLDKPIVDGEVYLDSTYLYSEPYGVQMRFADDPVRIVGSKLLFENFEMFANNDAPLNISGQLDFTDLANMMLDIRMRASNFKIIDAKENARSEAYGKAFVNFYGMMSGPLDNLRMRGKLDVLGNTDMTYVMRDAELSADNQLDELVRFTNFKDTTTATPTQKPAIKGLDMDLSMAIDEGAHIMCMLNADHSNYISLIGGGDLRMRYNPSDNLTLTGRYTLYNGEMKYSLPIIPLKTFTIQDGSYLEFTGDAMNPQMHITATERVKASVSEGNSSRAVEFDCGVKLTQTLNNLGLEFIIDAPNDMTISDQLKTMTTEGRSKAAVTMLASGMYLTDGNTSQFTMNSALNSFLQSEINNVAGKAMRSMGLDLGMSIDNTTTSGGMHTDYNFKFSKRLWNNRLSVNVGGKVSTGADIDMQQGDNNAFFDNVELEYRLDQNASKYLRVFYDNNKYDWLEGPLGEYGVGFVWRRKLRHFRDIFWKDKKESAPQPAPAKDDKKQQPNTEAKPTQQENNSNSNDKNKK